MSLIMMFNAGSIIDNIKNKTKITLNLIYVRIHVFRSGVNFLWDKEIVFVNQVLLSNQVLLHQMKLIL